MFDKLIVHSKWIFGVCLSINILLGIYIISIAPDEGGAMAAAAFIFIFLSVIEMFTLQLIASIIGFIFSKRKQITVVAIVANIFILIATITRYFF